MYGHTNIMTEAEDSSRYWHVYDDSENCIYLVTK